MHLIRLSQTGGSRLLLLSAVVLLHSLVPAGYMPTSVSTGWPVMLCPDGLPDGYLDALSGIPGDAHGAHHGGHHGGHHPHGDDTQSPSASDECPVGKAFKSSAIPTASLVAAAPANPVQPLQRVQLQAPVLRLTRSFDARAPPVFPLLYIV